MADIMKMLRVALGVAAVSWLLTWFYSTLKFAQEGIATISFAAVDVNVGKQISAGIDTSFAGKYVGSLIGSVPVGLQTFILLLVSAVIIVGVGTWINKQIGDFGKSENTKFAFDMAIGAIAIGLTVGFMAGTTGLKPNLAALGTALATLIYFLIVAGAYSLLRNFGLREVLPTPR